MEKKNAGPGEEHGRRRDNIAAGENSTGLRCSECRWASLCVTLKPLIDHRSGGVPVACRKKTRKTREGDRGTVFPLCRRHWRLWAMRSRVHFLVSEALFVLQPFECWTLCFLSHFVKSFFPDVFWTGCWCKKKKIWKNKKPKNTPSTGCVLRWEEL